MIFIVTTYRSSNNIDNPFSREFIKECVYRDNNSIITEENTNNTENNYDEIDNWLNKSNNEMNNFSKAIEEYFSQEFNKDTMDSYNCSSNFHDGISKFLNQYVDNNETNSSLLGKKTKQKNGYYSTDETYETEDDDIVKFNEEVYSDMPIDYSEMSKFINQCDNNKIISSQYNKKNKKNKKKTNNNKCLDDDGYDNSNNHVQLNELDEFWDDSKTLAILNQYCRTNPKQDNRKNIELCKKYLFGDKCFVKISL